MSAPVSAATPSRLSSLRKSALWGLARLWRSTVSVITTLAVLISASVAAWRISVEYNVPLTLVLLLAFCLLASLLHELGHAFAAWLIDWDVHVINVARISYLPARRAFGRVRIESNERLGGYVFATPSRLEEWSFRRYVLFLSGGVAANFFTVALCQIAALRLAASWPVVAALCVGLGLTSLVSGVLNLIPLYRDGGRASDGARLFDFLLGRKLSTSRRIVARVSGLTIDGVPARDWPPALIAAIETIDYPDRFALLANYYLAIGDPAKALAALRQIPSSASAGTGTQRCIHAFLVALVERDTASARALLAEPVTHDFAYWRALAVILAVEGRRAEACAAVAEARKVGLAEVGGAGDDDDKVLLAAIEDGRELPMQYGVAAT
ncbi:MAG TPA: hypothetical protein VHZ78_09675 [Rhizomicrobium sp.]|jgi:hypothetical protein|nr:hypothetical protein [Rhizomicrobium sp.]